MPPAASRERHDHLGQTLSAIEAKLVAMRNARAFHPDGWKMASAW
jgi:hypothetical protein